MRVHSHKPQRASIRLHMSIISMLELGRWIVQSFLIYIYFMTSVFFRIDIANHHA